MGLLRELTIDADLRILHEANVSCNIDFAGKSTVVKVANDGSIVPVTELKPKSIEFPNCLNDVVTDSYNEICKKIQLGLPLNVVASFDDGTIYACKSAYITGDVILDSKERSFSMKIEGDLTSNKRG
jgi:hypothetical protein